MASASRIEAAPRPNQGLFSAPSAEFAVSRPASQAASATRQSESEVLARRSSRRAEDGAYSRDGACPSAWRPLFTHWTETTAQSPGIQWPALHSLHLDTHPAAPSIADRRAALLHFAQHCPLGPQAARALVDLLNLVTHDINSNIKELRDDSNAALLPLHVYYLTPEWLALFLRSLCRPRHAQSATASASSARETETCAFTQLCFGMTLTGCGRMCVEVQGYTVRCAYIRVEGRVELPVFDVEMESMPEPTSSERLDTEWVML